MTMQQMNEYLEKRGFEVERTYMKQQGIYRFMIKRDGNITCGNFKYPTNTDWNDRNKCMQEFLDTIIRLHDRHYIMDMDVASWYPDPEKFWTKENPHVYISTARGSCKSLYNDELWKAYINADNEMTKNIYKRMVNSMYGANSQTIREVFETLNDKQKNTVYRIIGEAMRGDNNSPEIKDVIFNEPATIVFWADGTKTVVKCQEGDMFDPEKGLAMAIAKKVYGNKGRYFETVKKWCDPYYKKRANIQPWLDAIRDAIEKLKDRDI